jgi:glycosyltransferase involved in cell wall biosynthesis
MRIAIMAPDLQTGSVAAAALRHAAELSVRHTVHVITRAVPPVLPQRVRPVVVQPANWNWLRRYGHVPNELSFIWSARRALARLSAQECPDVVWCHSHALTALAAAPLKKRFGFRVLMTTHGDIFDRPKGTYSRELTWFYKGVTPSAYRHADRVHALSPNMASLAIEHGASPDRVRVIPSGMDPAEIGATHSRERPADSFMPADTLRLLYVGSLWNVKGVDVFLRAAAALLPLKFSIHLIGDGPERRALEALAADLGIGSAVIFHGPAPREQMAAHCAQADLLCVPSLSEAFSTVTLEAMLCGLPVVGSNTGGIPALITEGETGHLATPGDAASLAQCIRKATVSRDHLAALGANGQARARSDFTWHAIGDRLSALAEKALCDLPLVNLTHGTVR